MRKTSKTRSTRPKGFFSADEERAIVEAISEAERQTSAELRVHLEHHCESGNAYERARQTFEEIGMTATEARNGVLIYLATGDRLFAVLGDKGIDERVSDGFWEDVVEIMAANFRQGGFVAGMTLGIAKIAEKLARHFPHAGGADDVNELSNEISHGETDPTA
jgi:uncharacterized membrane protein